MRPAKIAFITMGSGDMRSVFASGRTHSGNTVLTLILGRVPTCLAQIDENLFFEHRLIVDRMESPLGRAERVFQLLKLELETTREPTRNHLISLARREPRISALELYREGMSFATSFANKRFWAQKATSYIFYAREILSSIPDAMMIYLVRNPYDIAASKKRRHKDRERIWNTMVSWNSGTRIALTLARNFPDRFRIVRYEDLTTAPLATVSSLIEWIGETFDPAYLEVPHVNRSETGYSLTGDGSGLNPSRVNYYLDNLSSSEIAGLDLLANRELLTRFYPVLPHTDRQFRLRSRIGGAALAIGGPAWYGIDYTRRLWHQPRLLLARTARRLTK